MTANVHQRLLVEIEGMQTSQQKGAVTVSNGCNLVCTSRLRDFRRQVYDARKLVRCLPPIHTLFWF